LHSKRWMTSPYASPFNAQGKLRQQRYAVPLAAVRRQGQDVFTLDDYTYIVRLDIVAGVHKFSRTLEVTSKNEAPYERHDGRGAQIFQEH
jgi:hypothetical protein